MNKMALRRLARQPWQPWEKRATTPQQMKDWSRDEQNFRPYGFLNNRYSVQISDEPTEWGLVIHLWIRRHDGEMVRSWSDMQRIKNELIGNNRIALEVFPKDEDLVDQANMAHLWVMPIDFVLPFSLKK